MGVPVVQVPGDPQPLAPFGRRHPTSKPDLRRNAVLELDRINLADRDSRRNMSTCKLAQSDGLLGRDGRLHLFEMGDPHKPVDVGGHTQMIPPKGTYVRGF
jgi:hypothetical protein